MAASDSNIKSLQPFTATGADVVYLMGGLVQAIRSDVSKDHDKKVLRRLLKQAIDSLDLDSLTEQQRALVTLTRLVGGLEHELS